MAKLTLGGSTALIGHTGFVGSNIARQYEFDDLYNTTNIGEISGREYDLVVSAAGRADSHRINTAPDTDLTELDRFAGLHSAVSIGKLVHLSTVCVFDVVDRCDKNAVSDPAALTPYGRNRLRLEQTLANRFDTVPSDCLSSSDRESKKGSCLTSRTTIGSSSSAPTESSTDMQGCCVCSSYTCGLPVV